MPWLSDFFPPYSDVDAHIWVQAVPLYVVLEKYGSHRIVRLGPQGACPAAVFDTCYSIGTATSGHWSGVGALKAKLETVRSSIATFLRSYRSYTREF